MIANFSYFGQSGLIAEGAGQTLSLAPNLAREAVAFDAILAHPLRFREAISALHDVVISDHRYKRRDKSAYEAWKAEEATRVRNLRRAAREDALETIRNAEKVPLPPDFEQQHRRLRETYWKARRAYAQHLQKTDMELWRLLMPCDPVITLADDVVFFECFSADESSYGCLTVDKHQGFDDFRRLRMGTTNVDYSWNLFHHFQGLRSYRQTRFRLDPAGFDVATQGHAQIREEKIDLPASWLRGFMTMQAAMALPMTKLTLTRESVYSLLAWLKRHKARSSPRALRFEQLPGQPPALVLEPWEQRIPLHGAPAGTQWPAPIRIWGRQRLLALARLLPLVESVDVHLLGTGFPSFWVAKLGEMRLTLGLSGWTANDWTRGSSLDLLAPPVSATREQIDQVAEFLQKKRAAGFAEIDAAGPKSAGVTLAALNHLAHTGQLIHDLAGGVYRWRQIMARALGEAELGPENAELVASRDLIRKKRGELTGQVAAPGGGTIYTGKVETKPVELLLDADGRMKRARCLCGHFQKAGLRAGPCRHLLALRWLALNQTVPVAGGLGDWFARLLAAAEGKGGAPTKPI